MLGGVDVGANLRALVSTGQVRDLTEYYRTSGLIERIPDNLIAQVSVEGRIYAIPQNLESVGVFLQQRRFRRAGAGSAHHLRGIRGCFGGG